MHTSSLFYGYATRYATQHDELVNRVRQAYNIEMVYLLGLTLHHQRTESLFSFGSITGQRVIHYYLLVLVAGAAGFSPAAIQDKIENNLQHYIPTTVMVYSVKQFTQWLTEAHPFAYAVITRPFLLYDSGQYSLPVPAVPNYTALQSEQRVQYSTTRSRVEAFLAGARLFRELHQPAMAAFLLHQAAEQCLSTMLQLRTGLRVTTHNLYKLVRYCTLFCYHLPALFSKENAAECRLLHLLQSAYLEARYKHSYTLTAEELDTLFTRVVALSRYFDRYCRRVAEEGVYTVVSDE